MGTATNVLVVVAVVTAVVALVRVGTVEVGPVRRAVAVSRITEVVSTVVSLMMDASVLEAPIAPVDAEMVAVGAMLGTENVLGQENWVQHTHVRSSR